METQIQKDVRFLLKVARFGKQNPLHDTARLVEIAERLDVMNSELLDLRATCDAMAAVLLEQRAKSYSTRGVAVVEAEVPLGGLLVDAPLTVTLGNNQEEGKPK